MDPVVLREIFSARDLRVSKLLKHSRLSSYACYRTLKELQRLGVVHYEKGRIIVLNSSSSIALKRLFFSGFDVRILNGNYLRALVFLLEPRELGEISSFLGVSSVQAYRVLNRLSQFLSKEGSEYTVSAKFTELMAFLKAAKDVLEGEAVWSNGAIRLLRIPKGMAFNGTLTAFSVFENFGIELNTDANYVVQPEQKPAPEEVLVHALRFSKDARDVMFCTLFYLKNRKGLDIVKTEREARRLGVLELWTDIVSWLNGMPIKNKGLFPSLEEFKEKAALYRVRVPEKFERKKSIEIFREIERHLSRPLNLFLIGGNALMEYGIKTATKDIDLVVVSEQSARELTKAIKKTGFAVVKPKELQYIKLGSALMLEKKGTPRIDLFVKKVCDCLDFSVRMQKRSSQIGGRKLRLFKASLEDIFLLKSVSSRDSDLADCTAILSKKALDWNTIMKEIREQKENLDKMQELTIIDHLEALEEMLKIEIPIKNRVINQALEKAALYLCEKKACSVKEIKAKIDFPEYKIRNMLKKLEREGKIGKIEGKPIKFTAR